MSTGTMNATQTPASNNPWSMEVGSSSGGSGDYVLCPPCNGGGVIIGIYDIGTQIVPTENGGTMEQRKLVLVFELSKKRADGQPFILAERYTWSMNDKSHFFGLVTNVTGRKYKDGERFNPLSLLGLPVMVNVTNTTNAKNKTYHKIGSVNQFPDGFPQPDPINHPIAWSVMTGEAFPAADYLPFVYGKSIKALADESIEGRRMNPSNATIVPPSQNSEVPF